MSKPTIIPERLAQLDTIMLDYGGHEYREEGMCAMEAVAWLADEPHSDAPRCACPVIAGIMRSWNDSLDEEPRQRLLRTLLPDLIGTRGSEALEERRRWRCLDWLVREYTPAWLDLAGLADDAAALRALPPITGADVADSTDVLTTITGARDRAVAARGAAGVAEGAVARAIARTVAGIAEGGAEGGAAGAAARAIAWAATGAAALAPTVEHLQASAQALIRELCAMVDEGPLRE